MDAPITPAEVDRWLAVVATAEECDTASGGPLNPATVNARAAAEAARAANGRRP